MTYGIIVRVQAPIEAYDASHAEVVKAVGDKEIPGFVLHTARATDEGFEVIEVWESKDLYDAFDRDVVGPAVAAAGMDGDAAPPEIIEFEPRTVISSSYAT